MSLVYIAKSAISRIVLDLIFGFNVKTTENHYIQGENIILHLKSKLIEAHRVSKSRNPLWATLTVLSY